MTARSARLTLRGMRRPFRVRTLLVAILAVLSAAPRAPAETIRLGIAISLKDAIEAIVPGFEKQTGHRLELTFGGSGQIAMQIRSGASIDLFIAAAQSQVDDLVNTGQVDASTVRPICGNSLVLVVPAEADNPADSFQSLREVKGRIAIGEPASVPAGQYAMQVFTALKLGDSISGKLVYGSNVRQVLAYVERGEAKAGIVYATDAALSKKVRMVAKADPSWHDPIVYSGVVNRSSNHAAAAKQFLEYLQTPMSREAMISRGFTVPSEPATQPAK